MINWISWLLRLVPEGLAAPNVTIQNTTSVYITWTEPARHNGILLGYEVHLMWSSTSQEAVIYSGTGFQTFFNGLDPYAKYQFRVAANTSVGSGYSVWTMVTMPEDGECENESEC